MPRRAYERKSVKTICSISFGIIGCLIASTAFAAESIRYQFTKVDISLHGSSLKSVPEDIDDDGSILTNARIDNLAEAVIAKPVGNGYTKFKTSTFSCTGLAFADTSASSINNKGQIVGSCADAPSAPSREFGFVRLLNGDHILLNFPGADHTLAFGINDRNHVVGHYYNPLIAEQSGLRRIHGFLWDGEKYSTLDFPLENTYTMLWSINSSGQILGEYYTFDPKTSDTLAHRWFVYDNGNFITDFESLEFMGGPAIYLADINDNGQILGQRWNGGSDWNGVFLYKAGTSYDIEFPAGWIVTDVRGMNNKGQFVGTYAIRVGIDALGPIYEHHGFIATPIQTKLAKPRFGPAVSLTRAQPDYAEPMESTAMPKRPISDLIRVKYYNFGKQFLKSVAK